MLDIPIIVGTNGDDPDGVFGPNDGIAFGLSGRDNMRPRVPDQLTYLFGGPDSDTYTFLTGRSGLIYDPDESNATSDMLLTNGIAYDDGTSFLATIEGDHLLVYTTENNTHFVILDYETSDFLSLGFGDRSVPWAEIEADLLDPRKFAGDLTWDEARDQGFEVPTAEEFAEILPAAIEREAALVEGIGQGLTVEEAKTVALLFEGAFDREGQIGLGGLNFHIDARERGLSERRLAEQFVQSEEFETLYGPVDELSNIAYVSQLFLNILNRPGDPSPDGGILFWSGRLAEPGFTQADALLAFVKAEENRERLEGLVDTLAEVEPGFWDFQAF